MAPDELFDHRGEDLLLGELSGLFADLRLEDRVKKDVAQLFHQFGGVVALQRLDEFVALLQKLPCHGGVSLLPVPGAPVGAAQPLGQLEEAVVGGGERLFAAHTSLQVTMSS